ncbi:MAG: hypothetical protein ACYC8T_21760 [Myxococcaceae bacterium]
MTKLLLGRLLPMGVAIALFTSALSPLRPALGAFTVAANALAGESNAGGTTMPEELSAPGVGGGVFDSMLGSLFGPKEKGQDAKQQIQGLVDSLKAKSEASEAESRAPRPIKPPGKAPGKSKLPGRTQPARSP